ncbi:MAG: c-type cytochrome [Rhodocyclaceae bacterium]|nr:MAG: c-type cytochrome [Rhodocyclaceae bacterium]
MKSSLVLALIAGVLSSASVQASEAIIKKARCVACHAVDTKRIGPPYKEVAEKYRGDAGAAERLMHKVRNGGSGVWGDMPMPPNGTDKISDADLALAVEWILGLK